MNHCINDNCKHCFAKFEKEEHFVGDMHVKGFYVPYCELGHKVQRVADKSQRYCPDYEERGEAHG